MNEEQKNVIFSALEGHSLIITGQCGTGKTFLLKHIIKELKKKNKEVAVTSTTGIASLQLHEGATTIHHWSGILDCRHNQSELKVLFDSDDRFQPPKDRITKADVLVIDEIGMMSKNVLETVEFVCRYVRKSKNDLAFGGLQVIASGDFKQLPPIENRRFEDDGAYCFTSNIFMKAFPHHVNLRKVMRQSEEDLVLAVNELCDGKPSSNTEELMKRLARPLHDPVNLVKIFGTNFDVDYVNQEMLDQMEGPEFVYKSIDKGDIKLLRKSPANRMLVLKVDAPVIIIRNIECRVFNGSRGVINKLTDSEIVVTINNKIFNIPCVNFDIYDKHKKKSLASRLQFPIKLAFALTVHRAQGQTLPYVEIDCLSFFSPGQIGVAVGRAVNKLGLRIVNYNDSAAQLKHPEEVYNFYYQTFNTLSGDISCCTGRVIESKELKSTVYESTVEQHQSLHEEDQFSKIEKRTCPWDMNEFLKDNSETNYVKCKPENQDLFTEHVEVLYSVVAQTCEKEKKKIQIGLQH